MKIAILLLLVPLAFAAVDVGPRDGPTADVVIAGLVTDASSGAPLTGVQVSVEGQHHGTLSGPDGRYVLVVPGLLDGSRIAIAAAHIGYGSARHNVRVRVDSDTLRLDFALQPSALKLNEMVVSDVAAAPLAMAAGFAQRGRVHAESWNTESYAVISENEFRTVAAEPLSTFSIDVDRASYSNVRRMIRAGSLPPKDAVRVEEMINYFPYSPATPRTGEPFAVVTELMRAPWQPQHYLARVSLHAERVDLRDMPAGNLVFLLDVSGSMTSSDKLPLLKQAMRMLVAELRPQDRVAIVVYAGSAGLVLESTAGSDKGRILEAIDRLEAGGSTAGGAGIKLAYDVARQHHMQDGNNRIILATDGDFNIGTSSDAEMVRLIEAKREQGTFLSVLGFGTGNLKDSKLEQIADHGNGNYAYIDNLMEARKVLVTEMGGTLLTVAKDVKVQVEFNPSLVRAYRLIGYENRLLAAEDFDDDGKDAGEIGAGHTVTALYEIVPAGVEGTVEVREPGELRYQRPAESIGTAPTNEIAFVKLRYKQPDGTTSRLLERAISPRLTDGSDDIRFASAVAGFGMLLRESENRGRTTWELVTALAADAVGDDPDGHRREFLMLIEQARALSATVAAEYR
jgi:Ca-activated chloride channel family protein